MSYNIIEYTRTSTCKFAVPDNEIDRMVATHALPSEYKMIDEKDVTYSGIKISAEYDSPPIHLYRVYTNWERVYVMTLSCTALETMKITAHSIINTEKDVAFCEIKNSDMETIYSTH